MWINTDGIVWIGGNNDVFQLRTSGKCTRTDIEDTACDGNTGQTMTISKGIRADSRDVVWNIDVDQTSDLECIRPSRPRLG